MILFMALPPPCPPPTIKLLAILFEILSSELGVFPGVNAWGTSPPFCPAPWIPTARPPLAPLGTPIIPRPRMAETTLRGRTSPSGVEREDGTPCPILPEGPEVERRGAMIGARRGEAGVLKGVSPGSRRYGLCSCGAGTARVARLAGSTGRASGDMGLEGWAEVGEDGRGEVGDVGEEGEAVGAVTERSIGARGAPRAKVREDIGGATGLTRECLWRRAKLPMRGGASVDVQITGQGIRSVVDRR
jgi:hypothetical protein